MKAEIHPNYHEITVTCSCGHSFKTQSALADDSFHIDVCDQCHPFYSGKQKIIDSTGRVERFKRRYSMPGVAKKEKKEEEKNS